jgi:chromate transporter
MPTHVGAPRFPRRYTDTPVSARPSASSLSETARLFLRLGATAFGGPAAHVAMMEEEIVGRRRWLSREQFLDYVSITNLIPGPNSTELAMEIGLARHGWRGLLAAGACFILPATLIVALVAWAYVRYGSLPAVAGVLAGVTPVVVAIIVRALWQLARHAVKSTALAGLLVLATLAIVAGMNELLVLLTAGAVGALAGAWRSGAAAAALSVLGAAGPGTLAAFGSALDRTVPYSSWTMFGVFAKIGAVLFGSGYVLIAFLRTDFVERLGWLSEQQLLDAIAVGQITPGPLFTTATFIGYLLGGPAGAAVATIGIFLPAFVFVAISGPIVPRIRRSPVAGAALDGVNVASLALIVVVSWQLGLATLVAPFPSMIFVVSLVLLMWSTINTSWLIAAGALLGWLVMSGS